jgi:hypothetical protein
MSAPPRAVTRETAFRKKSVFIIAQIENIGNYGNLGMRR